MQHVDANHAELREICELYFSRTDSRLDARFAAFGQMMDGHLAALREEVRVGHARCNTKVETALARSDVKLETGLAHIETKFERRFGDLLKWSFVFWCGAVAAIAALAKVLR